MSLSRKQRQRVASWACWGVFVAVIAWAALDGEWWEILWMTGGLVVLVGIVVGLEAWIKRGRAS